jgi:hypothetical protein
VPSSGSGRWRLEVTLAVIGSLVALGMLFSLSSHPDEPQVAIIRCPSETTPYTTDLTFVACWMTTP